MTKMNPQRLAYPLPKYLEYRPGWVYAVKVGDFVKIGRTKSPKNRLEKYKMYPPFNTEVIFLKAAPDQRFFERALQLYFSEFAFRGEWYDLPKYKLDYKKEIEQEYERIMEQVKSKEIFGEYWEKVEENFREYARKY